MPRCANDACDNPKGLDLEIVARGLCAPCYSRLHRRGTLARAYVVNAGVCSVEGCGKRSFAKNLCQSHYNQAEDPLKRAWKNLRARYPGQFPPEWSLFAAFAADVPPQPSGAHQLRRTRVDEPWSRGNMHWLTPVQGTQTIKGMSRREYHSKYGRVWNDKNKYGITAEQRAEMLAAQDGRCAICRQPESAKNPHHPEQEPRRLNIDHDHKTGLVRGLLCVRCNSMIGERGANESIDTLRAAIAYLELHANEGKSRGEP